MAKNGSNGNGSRNVYRVTARVRNMPGSAMLVNPATPEMLDNLFKPKTVRKTRRDDLTMEQVAESRLYRENFAEDGDLGIPTRNLLASLVAAGRHIIHEGKSKLSTRDNSIVPGLINFEQPFIRFNKKRTSDWNVSAMRGRIPNEGTAVCIVRPEIKEWASEDFSFTFTDQGPAAIDEAKIKQLFETAGTLVGLGDFRPSCKGPYGKFYVSYWKIEKLEGQNLPMDEDHPEGA